MKKKNKVKGKGEVSMSLYEINQSLISQLPAYNDTQTNELINKINNWATSLSDSYYMLLCRDINYYTTFHQTEHDQIEFQNLGQAVIAVLTENNYTIHSDEQSNDHFEIWAKNTSGTYAFILFPYDWGIVNYG